MVAAAVLAIVWVASSFSNLGPVLYCSLGRDAVKAVVSAWDRPAAVPCPMARAAAPAAPGASKTS